VRGTLAFAADMDLQELWLMDNAPERLSVIAPLCQQIVKEAGSPFVIKATSDLDEALRGADVIVTTISCGERAWARAG